MSNHDENIHAGHRERLLETVSKVGLADLNDIQIMEFILFYVFPRGDTNPLAHRLLDKFKSISVVLDASVEDLAAVKGMGETSAKKLKALIEIFNVYITSKVKSGEGLKTFGDIYDYSESLLRYKTSEEMHIFGFNNKGDFVADRCLAKGTLKMVGIDMRQISNFVNTYKVPYVYIAHNHPGGSCMASEIDKISHEELKGKFAFTGTELRDNFIVGVDGIYSMEDRTMKRIFGEHEKYKDILSIINNTEEK